MDKFWKSKKTLFISLIISLILYSSLTLIYSAFASDEAFYLNTAIDFLEKFEYTGGSIAPIYPMLVTLFYFFGSESGAKFVNVIFTLISAVIVYLFAKNFFDKRIAILSAIFFLTLPINVTLSGRILPDVPFNTFFILSVFLFMKGVEHRKKFLPASALASIVAFFTRYSSILLLPIFILYFLIKKSKIKEIFLDKYVYISIALAVALFYTMPWIINGFIPNYTGSAKSYFLTDAIEEPSHFYLAYFPLVPLFLLPFFIHGSYIGLKRRDKNTMFILFAIIILVAFKLFFLPIREFRYLVDITMFVSVISAISFHGFAQKFKKKNFVSAIFIFIITVNFLAGVYIAQDLAQSPKYVNLREVSLWAKENCNPPLITNAGRQVQYYTGYEILQFNEIKSIPSEGQCIVYSEHEPAIREAIESLDDKTEIYRINQVVVYRN